MDKFDVKVKMDRFDGPDYCDMAITHNGYQWTSVQFSKKQAIKIISELTKYLVDSDKNTVIGDTE